LGKEAKNLNYSLIVIYFIFATNICLKLVVSSAVKATKADLKKQNEIKGKT
jgi:hypothetical protein